MTDTTPAENVIDLNTARAVLNECLALVETLHGKTLDETLPSGNHRSAGRSDRAERSRSLTLLANRCELVAALARNEYWVARGLDDHLHPLTTNARD